MNYDPTSKSSTTDAFRSFGMDPNGNNEAWGAAIQRLFPGVFQQAVKGQQFGAGLQQQGQDAISRLLHLFSQQGQNTQLQGMQRGNTEQAAQGAHQASLTNRSMGLGDGFQAGTTNQMFGQANRMNNDLSREYASPEHHMQLLQNLLGAVNMGQQNPAMDELYRMGSVFEQRHAANQQEMGSGSFLRQAAPYIGAALPYLTGGMGGGMPQGFSQGGNPYQYNKPIGPGM